MFFGRYYDILTGPIDRNADILAMRACMRVCVCACVHACVCVCVCVSVCA